ncbi:Rtt106-domain-containing protein [Coniochaeta ligniaria NRRL 30616]|uniref:Rtt106-domain-containing protein n=1 Tax=Coniochaeta ligniaria NRRL 30616 TaxID=1408157 RepID=A0A1J7IWV4_9PEZI|nr:Rtt106-domain-containing protein [Coniochaeta ligniaria NRRL 30616]
MPVALDQQRLGLVFQSRPDILAGIQKAADSPARVSLFNDIASFVYDRLPTDDREQDQPAAKRRRVEVANGHASSQPLGGAPAGTVGAVNGADAAAADPVLLEIKDISLTVPQRKKYGLCFTKNFLYARAAGSAVPVQGIVYAWRDIEHALCLPVPEKAAVQHNYVLFPRGSYLPSPKASNASSPDLEPLVFTVSAAAPKPNTVSGAMAGVAASVSDSYTALFEWALTTFLRSGGNTTTAIITADARVFHSAARQPFRPSEKAVHVKAFRGSKDGYLFFLPTGILWGFKKPLLFLPLDRVVAVSYTSVLQRTFNIVVEVDVGNPDGKTEEIEFAMLDQEDYQGINEMYIHRHGLQDRSMADARKAKRQLAENAKKKADGGEGVEGAEGGADDGLTELERAHLEAEQQLQDDEDEEEEDYDPGSEGESEGSGSSSEEEEDGDGDGEGEEFDDDDEGDEE